MLQHTVSQNRDVRQSQEPTHRNIRPEITLKVEIQFERNFHPCNVASPRRILQDVQHPVTELAPNVGLVFVACNMKSAELHISNEPKNRQLRTMTISEDYNEVTQDSM